ncbi:MAG: M12 family metallo-peptidase [Bacteroidota bacterium]
MNSKINISQGNRLTTWFLLTIRTGLLSAFLITLSSNLYANTFRYVNDIELDEQQSHFYNVILTDEPNMGATLFTVDLNQFKKDQLVLNFPDGSVHIARKKETLVEFGSREVWYGNLDGGGEVHLVPNHNGEMLTGTIYLPHRTWAIRSLGKGIQAMIDYDASGLESCGNHNDAFEKTIGDPDPDPDPGSDIDGYEPESNAEALNDECYIRVIVAYTTTVGNNEADPLSLIMDAMSQTNAAYNNSGINQQVKLAYVYETNYDDTGKTQGTVLGEWRATSDGNMDEVHSFRSATYRADMCALITNVGSGIAYTGVSYGNAFSCTRRTFVSNKTFQHELGHNHSCQHDPLNYSGSSNYRGYGNPSGIFRTVMAYGSSCGVSPCTRVNEFSGITNTYTQGGSTYSTGNSTQNNVAGHNNNNGTIVAYTSIQTDLSYSGAYNFQEFDFANYSGENTAQYNSASNQMIFNDGAEGSMNAGESVTLGEGFWARSGSTFTASLEPTCTSISLTSDPTNSFTDHNTANERLEVDASTKTKVMHNHDHLQVFPNPFSESATVKYVVEEDGPVTIMIFDLNGKMVANVVNSINHSAGDFNVNLDGYNLPPGLYQCRMTTMDEVKVIGVAVSR